MDPMEAIRVTRALWRFGPRTVLAELKYYYLLRPLGKFRPWLATKYPSWLVQDCLIRAGVKMIDDHETVPEVPFMTVLDRWGKGLRDRKPVRR
jgi:hypothetical protein